MGAAAAVVAVTVGVAALGSAATYTPRLQVRGTVVADPSGDRLVATLAVPARSADRVHVGQTLRLHVVGRNAAAGGRWEGRVIQVSRAPLPGAANGVRVELIGDPRSSAENHAFGDAGTPVAADIAGGRTRLLDRVLALVRSMQPPSRERVPAT